MSRRRRQYRLFLIAVMLPAVLVALLAVRFVSQEKEISLQRIAEEQRNAVAQAGRELTGRLETIQFQELSRRIGKMATPQAANPAIVFVAATDGSRLILPWETQRAPVYPNPLFVSNREIGETKEYQSKDDRAADEAYRRALKASRLPEERCDVLLGIGRVLARTGNRGDALEIYKTMLTDCGSALDDSGMPFAFYAANRLIDLKLDVPLAEQYLIRQIETSSLRPLSQASMLGTLLKSIESEAAVNAAQRNARQMLDIQQILSLSDEFKTIRTKAETNWVAYGPEPWLLRSVPATSSSGPLLFAISTAKVAPPDVKLIREDSPGSFALGPQFTGLSIELAPRRSFGSGGAPVSLYTAGIALILALTILGGYLLLRDVNRDLQLAEMRSHFVASVSHELKTPLTAVRMFAQTLVLKRTRDERTRDEYLETIMNESDRLSRFVDNVLDFSKIEQGKKIYLMRPATLPDAVRAAARAMQYPLAQQGFHLNVSIGEGLPRLEADADALEQAILNLLSNAMKYSGDARQIDLSCSRQNGEVVIAVVDHGIGISARDQPHIFEKFYRVRSSATELIAGTGLGLTLVKHIAEAHAGSVDVKSAIHQGSTFSIRIPVPPEVS